MKKLTILPLMFLFFMNQSIAQSFQLLNQKTLGGTLGDVPICITTSSDGGYFISNSSLSGNNGDKNCQNYGFFDNWICKLNNQLDVEWQSCYGGNEGESIPVIIDNFDKILVFCNSNSGISGNKNISYLFDSQTNSIYNHLWVIETDVQGAITNQKVYGGEQGVQISNVIKYNNGFLCVGSIKGEPGYDLSESTHGAKDYWLLYLDNNLNKVWDRAIGGLDNESGGDIIIYNDFIYISGLSLSNQSYDKSENNYSTEGGRNVWLVKLDNNGQILWDRTIGTIKYEDGSYICATTSGVFIATNTSAGIGGTKTEGAKGNEDIWITKLSHDGQILADKTIGTNKFDRVTGIENFGDTGIILSAYTKASQEDDLIFQSYGNEDIWVMMLDNNLNILAQGLYGGANYDAGSTNILHQNDKITIAATSTSGASGVKNEASRGNSDAWILQLQYNGTGISGSDAQSKFGLWPNPTAGWLNVSGSFSGANYAVKNVEGKTLQSGNLLGSINLSDFKDGIYFIEIKDSIGNVHVNKIALMQSLK